MSEKKSLSLYKYQHLVQEKFKRSSGPGGQNVNKVSTAVELRFDVCGCDAFNDAAKNRLKELAGRCLTENGLLILQSDRYRTQDLNRKDVWTRLQRYLDRALEEPRVRFASSPPRASREQRRQNKAHRSRLKKQRRSKLDLEKG